MIGKWKSTKNANRAAGRKGGKSSPRGFALVLTLLLLSMMSLMALAMILTSSSDM